MTAFAELVAATAFSFLRGASHPGDMVGRALELGMAGIGIADRNTVAGVVRAHVALRRAREDAAEEGVAFPDFRLVVGARLVFADGTPDIIAYPATRHGWGRLMRLLTLGNRRAEKGNCILHLDDLMELADEMLFILMAGPRQEAFVARMGAAFPGAVWLAAMMPRGGSDHRRLARQRALSARTGVPLLATNDALYATPAQRPLHDVMTCIADKVTIATAGRRLLANAERHLKPPGEMARLFRHCPEALAASGDILSGLSFTLDDLSYQYPDEPVPGGWEAQGWLEHLTLEAARARYPDGIPAKLQGLLDEEFRIIAARRYAAYFLTVHDIVSFARKQDPPILCQGRGSAANSAVCFLLGITSVDPMAFDLLFSRFVSEERNEPPDIDVDFEHERREEVMQYIYRRYGRHRAAIAATVIHYRPRSAVREVGKVLGFSEDATARLSGTTWGSHASAMEEQRLVEAGYTPDNPAIARLKTMVDAILQFPRHLSQHVGGYVLTQDRLDETVPIHNAAMADRTFIEWDKDDIDALGLMKVDILALGMLSCVRKGFELMRDHGLGDHALETIPWEDPAVYDMLCAADSIGVFQVESRAQINMLPRMRPRCFYDLAIQVAIVRPGPIEGDMVHPYLRRRQGKEKVEFPSPRPPYPVDELKGVLGKTLGVPLFQEQAMKLAIVAAEFSNADANRLRRAMATFRNVGTINQFQEKMVEGMVRRGYERDFAMRCYQQIQGFGSYGFPESHAISFARLVYVSSWLKCHYPAVFACALLNAQPMGFYAPAQIVRDAQDHGVEVRPLDVNASEWDNGLEGGLKVSTLKAPLPARPASPSSALPEREGLGVGARVCAPERSDLPSAVRFAHDPPQTPPFKGGESRGAAPPLQREATRPPPTAPASGRGKALALRIGFRQMDGFRRDWAERIIAARTAGGAFASMEDVARRAALPQAALRRLADADAFGSLGLDRREALWAARRTPDGELPLFAASAARELGDEADMALPVMAAAEQVAVDYQTLRLSLKGHPMAHLRSLLIPDRVISCAEVSAARNGRIIRTAGIVLVRQRPGKGNAIFVSIEDETGVTNIVLWARLFDRYRRDVMAARLMLVEGEVQRSSEGIVHLMARHVEDRSHLLARLTDGGTPVSLSRADEFLHPQHPRGAAKSATHPRNVRILPKSRDFH